LRLALLFVGSTSHATPSAASRTSERLAESSPKKRLSDAQIKKLLIDESIAAYEGNCPCPYSRARNGSRCGRRSAYNHEGGAAPLSYPADVTAEVVQAYRNEHCDG
jgi:hypothetical protein